MAAEPTEHEILQQALAAGPDCPPIETLERLLQPNGSPEFAAHVSSCSYCRTELDLLRAFHTAPRNVEESVAVRAIADGLRSPLPARTGIPETTAEPWWRHFFRIPWLTPAAMAVAGILVVVAIGLQWRGSGAPEIHAPSAQPVMRSDALTIVTPLGDVQSVPSEIQWQPVAGAVRYEVRLMEVDRHELWKTSVDEPRSEFPPQVQAMIVPAKTLMLEIAAFDSAGRHLAQSGPVRFRLLQNVYRR